MTLLDAPFLQNLRVISIQIEEGASLVLRQMGISVGKSLEKVHAAPLGDPLAVRVGGQRFSLRKEICARIHVERAE